MNTDYSQAVDSAEAICWVVNASMVGERLDRVLAQHLSGFSRSRLQRWIELGAVRVDGRIQASKSRLALGAQVEVLPQPSEAQQAFEPDDVALDIVFEDQHVLCVNKPAGLVTHPGHGNWRGTLMNGLLFHRPGSAKLPRAGIVHRLDKDTSGLMVVAKTDAAMQSLVGQLANRQVDRRYLALVHGDISAPQVIAGAIGRDPRDPLRMAVVGPGAGRPATTLVVPVARGQGVTLVQCKLATGRTHQIRVHLADAGHSLLGDSLYGRKNSAAEEVITGQALHAWRLAFQHPAELGVVTQQALAPSRFLSACAHFGMAGALDDLAAKPFIPNLSADLPRSL